MGEGVGRGRQDPSHSSGAILITAFKPAHGIKGFADEPSTTVSDCVLHSLTEIKMLRVYNFSPFETQEGELHFLYTGSVETVASKNSRCRKVGDNPSSVAQLTHHCMSCSTLQCRYGLVVENQDDGINSQQVHGTAD